MSGGGGEIMITKYICQGGGGDYDNQVHMSGGGGGGEIMITKYICQGGGGRL